MEEWIVELVRKMPLLCMIVFSLLVTIFITLLYKKFTNQERGKEIRKQQKEFQQKQKEFRNEPQKLLEMQNEMMKLSMEQMKESFKPLLISFLPLILFFGFLKNVYAQAGIGDIVAWNVNLPLIGTGAGWLLTYIVLSMIFNSILRKVLKVY
ncbi:MAG: EMC3/TMCO1 family protein [archaeon]